MNTDPPNPPPAPSPTPTPAETLAPSGAVSPSPAGRPGGPPATANARRRRYALRSAVLLLAITASCVFAGIIANRASARIDVTATRQHDLSAQTRAVLAALPPSAEPYQIVVAGDLAGADRYDRQRTLDVLDAFVRASRNNIRVTLIPIGSAAGLAEYDATLRTLADRFAPRIDAIGGVIRAQADNAEAIAGGLDDVSAALTAVRDAIPEASADGPRLRGYVTARAAAARVAADELRTGATAARDGLEQNTGDLPVPPTDVIATALADRLTATGSTLQTLLTDARDIANFAGIPAAAREPAGELVSAIPAMRDRAARGAAALTGLHHPPVLSVARALGRSSAVLVIAPPRTGDGAERQRGTPEITAIAFDALFPPMLGQPGATRVDRWRSEELLAAALSAVSGRPAPILVVVHDVPGRLSPSFERLTGIADRMRLRGVDILEWATAGEDSPPSLDAVDPTGTRPVVYFVFGTPATNVEAAGRMARLARAVESLLAEGRPVLLSANPSTLPTFGQPDPLVEPLARLGLRVDTGRTVLRSERTPVGSYVAADHRVLAEVSEHPIAGAVGGLPVGLVFPVPMAAADGGGAVVTPLITAQASPTLWAETEWVDFAQVPMENHPLVANPPQPGPRDTTSGTLTLAAALETRGPDGASRRAAVVVGGLRWFIDDIVLQSEREVDGRVVSLNPGNGELFEAAVFWLAGYDPARTASARAIALIPPMEPAQLSVLRWALIAGLPIVILLCGAAYRLVRG